MITLWVGMFFSIYQAIAATPGSQVQWSTLNSIHNRSNPKWGPVLKDIKDHEPPTENYTISDLITMGHEVSHGIHAYLRNKNTTGKKINGFYVLNNRAVIVEEPNMRKSKVASYVPTILRDFRYKTYIVGQVEWDDTPLYIYDEWNSYVNGMETGVDLANRGMWSYGWRDCFNGAIEFNVYAIATAMAVKDNDPNYFKNYKQFMEFTAWNIERAMKLYNANKNFKDFKDTRIDTYLYNLRTHSLAKAMREFAIEQWGTTWTKDVLGF